MGCMLLPSLLESLYSVSAIAVPGGWRVHLYLCYGVETVVQTRILSGSCKSPSNIQAVLDLNDGSLWETTLWVM